MVICLIHAYLRFLSSGLIQNILSRFHKILVSNLLRGEIDVHACLRHHQILCNRLLRILQLLAWVPHLFNILPVIRA